MTAKTVRSVSMQELAPAIVQAIQTGGSAELTVTGRSMMPFLRDRVSRVRLTAISQPKRGDVVLYRRQNGGYVLHRIAACCGDGTYVMCGDAQTVLEPSIRRDQLIAVMTAFARGERWRGCDDPAYRLWWRLRLADRRLRHLWLRVCRRLGFGAQ